MNKHLKYLSYVLRHKWYVFIECWKHGLYWQGISHDMSKFLPREWFPYVERFYGSNETVRDKTGYYDPTANEEFSKAWFWHQKCNKHHWQYWIQPKDNGELKCMEIPFKYCLEMVCDWAGAGRAQGFSEPVSWYRANKDKLILHENSRLLIENCLWEFFGDGYMRDYWVDVCDECYRACCWHGEDMCEEARYAGIIKKKASELRKLKLEHPSYFAKETLDRVCGGFDWVE